MSNEAAITSASGHERAGRREQNKAENRAALLKAARSVFAEIGYGAAGVRDIVRRTDLASGTFYKNFVAADPEILAFGRNNVGAVRNLIDKPDLRHLADALNADIVSAISRGILPNVDPAYLIASLSGVVFEISVIMLSRTPVDPAA